jgi:hypothetical protein
MRRNIDRTGRRGNKQDTERRDPDQPARTVGLCNHFPLSRPKLRHDRHNTSMSRFVRERDSRRTTSFRASSAAAGKSCRASRQKSGKIPADLSGTPIALPCLSS